MTVAPRTRLGAYEITARLGAGGQYARKDSPGTPRKCGWLRETTVRPC